MACLKAYQAQIAPHFLYNTLDSINWMLIENEEYTISNIVVALGGLLGYSISNDGNLKTVADELEQIKNYLLIQQVRFGDRLKYSIDIDTAIHQQLIIKLLLQPFG
ncbi:MAG: sensor histidine kinase [Waltera sp.]